MVEHVAAHFDGERITPCSDNVTHSTFEALMPGVKPRRFGQISPLFAKAPRIVLYVATSDAAP
jgi:hypothetical protein